MTASAAPASGAAATTATAAATGTGTGTAAATTAAATSTATTTAAASGAFDWKSVGLSDDNFQYVQAKSYQNVDAVVTARRAAEKLIGVLENQIIKLPQDDKPESWAPIYERLGRPKSAGEYGLEKLVPEGQDATFAKTAAEWLHAEGLNTKQAQGITGKWNKFVADQQAAAAAKQQETEALQRSQIKAEWADQFEERFKVAQGAAEKFGMTADQLEGLKTAMGPAHALKFLHAIGAKLGVEPGFVQGNREGGFGVTPAEAVAKIAAAKQDPAFRKRLAEKDMQATADWRMWHKIGYPHGEVNTSPTHQGIVRRA